MKLLFSRSYFLPVFILTAVSAAPVAAATPDSLSCETSTPPPTETSPAPTRQTLTITHSNDSHARVIWGNACGKRYFSATFVVFDVSIFGESTRYDLSSRTDTAVPQLTVSRYQNIGRGGCGRGGCTNAPHSTEARLLISTDEADFTCHELVQGD